MRVLEHGTSSSSIMMLPAFLW